jgi:heat shock protein HslJ
MSARPQQRPITSMQTPLVPAVAIAALLAACTTYQAHEAHERRLTIAPDPVPCADGTPGSCVRVTDADGDSWITHPEEIEGFTYEPGFAYELLVEEPSQVAEIEAATPPRLSLIRVLSKQQSGEPGRVLDADLGQRRWVLTAIEPSGHSASDWATSGITAQFDVWGSRLSGNAGCNNYSAALAVSGDSMQVSAPAATRKACPSKTVMELEQEYLERIANASAFTVTGDRLQLSLSDGSGMAFDAENR